MMQIRAALLRRIGVPSTTDTQVVDWGAIYADQLPRVYNYFRFRTGDSLLAEDLTAATFEKAWRVRAQYRDDRGAVSTWLFTVARSVAASHFRQHTVLHQLPFAHAEDQADGMSVADEAQHRSDLARLHALLSRLPGRERELIELKYGAALTNRALAQLLEMSESNVGTRLHRIVARLRHEWEEHEI